MLNVQAALPDLREERPRCGRCGCLLVLRPAGRGTVLHCVGCMREHVAVPGVAEPSED